MTVERGSGFGKDPLGSRFVKTVGPPGADELAFGSDLVDNGTGTVAGGIVDLGPGDGELIPGPDPDTVLDGSGHDPLDIEQIVSSTGPDNHRPGVLGSDRVDAVDGVDPGQVGIIVTPDRQVTREGTGIDHGNKGNGTDSPGKPLHFADGSSGPPLTETDETYVLPRWLKLSALAFFMVIAAAMAFAIFEPIQVLPRIRLAPGYALVADDGSSITSETARGSVTLYSFAPTDCTERCDDMFATMRSMQARVAEEIDLGDTEYRLITIALDDLADPEILAAAQTASGADGQTWRWIGGDENNIRLVVGTGFERFYETEADGSIAFDPAFVLVDGNGIIRGEYRYQTLADDADKFIRHIEILAEEIRYASGPASMAYEAAHLFLCYP